MANLLVADTDLVIDYLRDNGPGAAFLTQWELEGRLQLTAVTAFELRSGRDFQRRSTEILTLLARRTLPLDTAAALCAGAVFAELQAAGRGMGFPDVLQAGICLRHDVPLATRNVRHFERVPGLRLVALDECL